MAEANEISELQAQEMESLEEEIQKLIEERGEKDKHIQLLGDQINKYKKKIRELSDEKSILNSIGDTDDNAIQNYFNVDIFQHKYYELSKLHQAAQEQYRNFQLTSATSRHYSGILLANLYDTLP